VLDFTETEMTVRLIDPLGRDLFRGTVAAGTSQFAVPTAVVGIA
jgi:hypothetical protein